MNPQKQHCTAPEPTRRASATSPLGRRLRRLALALAAALALSATGCGVARVIPTALGLICTKKCNGPDLQGHLLPEPPNHDGGTIAPPASAPDQIGAHP
ncbi:hypothetical protein [Haliangium sp.]|uniref:hypothetical protein n=1 Tax=Haliangium sp. TaxID=2663208 RepID=UPI003D0A847B